jgi:hypothetical protein
MNKTFNIPHDGRLRRRLGSIGLSLFATISLSTRCRAAALAPNSPIPTPSAVSTLSPATSISSALSTRPASKIAPANYAECLTLLQGTDRVSPVLVEAVAQLLNHPEDASQAVPQRPPSLLAVTWRENAGQVRDIVVQAYYDPIGGDVSTLNADGYVRARLGGELSNSANQLLGLMYEQVVYFGPKDQVAHEQRAFQAAINGDMTLLREQTVDPLRLLVVMPHGGTFLPSSLRSRVRGLVLDATLDFGTWSGQIGMVTSDGESAQQVATIVSAWRDMAVSLADTFASYSSGKQLRQALQASTVQVVANRVLASAAVDSRTIVRASKEITGHGGGCPPGGICSADTVAVCHAIDATHAQTLCVAPTAVAAHLASGDRCGPCEGDGHP